MVQDCPFILRTRSGTTHLIKHCDLFAMVQPNNLAFLESYYLCLYYIVDIVNTSCVMCLFVYVCVCVQSFCPLPQRPLSVDLTVEEGQRLKVIYGSLSGFHAIDVDSGTPYDLYLPTHVRPAVPSVRPSLCLSVHISVHSAQTSVGTQR